MISCRDHHCFSNTVIGWSFRVCLGAEELEQWYGDRRDFLADLPTHATRASRSPRFRPCSPDIRKKSRLFCRLSQSQSHSRSRKRPYDLVKIENWSRKRSHKLNGIRVGRIKMFPFLPIHFTTPSLMIQWKLGCRSQKQKRKNQPITRPGIEHCHWSILPLLLATPTMQFSLDHKRHSHKPNQCSASDSVGLIFTRLYHSMLLITTLTTTPSLVKTSLYW